MKPAHGRALPAVHDFAREERASSLIEVAASLLLLLSVIFGIVAMSRLAYAKHFVTFAARQGTRYAAVRGATFAARPCSATVTYACQAATTDVASYIQTQVPLGLATSSTTVTTVWPGLAGSGISCLALSGARSPGCLVQVTVRYSFSFGVPFFPAGSFTLQSTSQTPILQ